MSSGDHGDVNLEKSSIPSNKSSPRILDDKNDCDDDPSSKEGSFSGNSEKVSSTDSIKSNRDVGSTGRARKNVLGSNRQSLIQSVDPTPKQRQVQQALMMQDNRLQSLHMSSVSVGLQSPNRWGLVPLSSVGYSEKIDVTNPELIVENTLPAAAAFGDRSLMRQQFTTHSVTKPLSRKNLLGSKLNLRRNLLSNVMAGPQYATTGRLAGPTLQQAIPPPGVSWRYKVGEYVLIENSQTQWVNCVNRFGFRSGEGETVEECQGPYIYVLATVKQIHFEEIHPYYTVTRCDMGTDQRADAEIMEPLRTQRGELAALRAADDIKSGHQWGSFHDKGIQLHENDRTLPVPFKCAAYAQNACCFLLLPVWRIWDSFHFVCVACLAPPCQSCLIFFRRQAHLFLYGREPYVCRWRLTAMNFVVACSTWFMFIDQVRLAFFPPSADHALAVVNLGVWSVLVLELLFEVFIRANGYRSLIISDKAYAPTTVRYINGFHFFVESLSLGVFVPEFSCVFSRESCSQRLPFSFYNAALIGVTGPTHRQVFYGHAFIALTRLRVFGLVRHWKNMWINKTFINMTRRKKQGGLLSYVIPPSSAMTSSNVSGRSSVTEQKRATRPDDKKRKRKDAALTNASNIGTALMATNSYRALAIVWAVIGLFPIVFLSVSPEFNDEADSMTAQLQATNLVASDTSEETCVYLTESVASWLVGISSRHYLQEDGPYLMTLDLQPYRCGFDSNQYTNVQICEMLLGKNPPAEVEDFCKTWSAYAACGQSISDLASASGIREGSIVEYNRVNNGTFIVVAQDGSIVTSSETSFSVVSRFDQTISIRTAAVSSLLLQICLLGTILGGLSVLRRDAEVLVLGPLRRMLKIVARYARNPLAQPKDKVTSSHRGRGTSRISEDGSDFSSYGNSSDEDDFSYRGLGSFETEQLITAVAKITDLLRKCWGVAGADIISTNLATREGALTEVFNPTVPGKSVYALFGFAAIGGFENALRNLGGDVMPLINDIAAVLHGEVFRWGFGDSGQCNKNLGSAFLMVFRIGLVKEVIEKLEQATDVVFSTSSGKRSQVTSAVRRRQDRRNSSFRSSSGSTASPGMVNPASSSASNARRKAQRSHSAKAMRLSLQSLPGISTFTDRAVIGMLKSFAGIHRDKNILSWNDDFRLGAGVGAFKISMIFGMDAGWAVEGAVGSEYKIDATYLSPHVNMASRMTSACKQYDVSIMLSQAVQELMSDVAQSKLRHLDTVTVKGSELKQKIYTYDARARGVDFFLHSRSEEQADCEAERYSPAIWTTDQDLTAMRQHVTDEFFKIFQDAHKAYIAGDWPTAIQKMELANGIMFQTAVDDGYLEDEFDAFNLRPGEDIQGAADELKREYGDGPSMYLISFMRSHGGSAPKNWDGWHPLTRK